MQSRPAAVDNELDPDPVLIIAPDNEGHWLVQEVHGLLGGMFTSADSALRFARAECRALPGARLSFAATPPAVGPWHAH